MVAQTEALELELTAEAPGVYSVKIYADARRGDLTSAERRTSLFFNVVEGLPD